MRKKKCSLQYKKVLGNYHHYPFQLPGNSLQYNVFGEANGVGESDVHRLGLVA